MPLYHLHVSSGSRGDGASAGAAASYILRLGRYARGREAATVSGSGNLPSWCDGDPLALFAAADRYERANGRLYVAIEAALPVELGEEEHVELVRGMVAEVAGRDLPYLWTIHPGRPAAPGRPRNWHFHSMFSERINDGIGRDAALWFRRANPRAPVKGGAAKARRLKGHGWVDGVRHAWERRLNERLERAGVELVTCESHRTRIARAEAAGDQATADRLRRHPPGRHIGPAASAIERGRPGRPGQPTERGALARASAVEAARLRERLELIDKQRRQLQDDELRDARAAARDAGLDVDSVIDDAPAGYALQLAALDAATRNGREAIRTDARVVGFSDVELERIRSAAAPDNSNLGWAAVVKATAAERERQAAATAAPLCRFSARQEVPRARQFVRFAFRQEVPLARQFVRFAFRQEVPLARQFVRFTFRQEVPRARQLVRFAFRQEVPPAQSRPARRLVRFSGRQDVSRSRKTAVGVRERARVAVRTPVTEAPRKRAGEDHVETRRARPGRQPWGAYAASQPASLDQEIEHRRADICRNPAAATATPASTSWASSTRAGRAWGRSTSSKPNSTKSLIGGEGEFRAVADGEASSGRRGSRFSGGTDHQHRGWNAGSSFRKPTRSGTSGS